MKSILATLAFILTGGYAILAQDCGCDHTIAGNNSVLNIINASDFNYSPGDVFCINGGDYSAFRLIGFEGTSQAPLIIKNCNGQVKLNSPTYNAIQFLSSKYIHLTGTGDDNFEYGIQVLFTKQGTSGVSVSGLSTDFEIDHLDISKTGFAGIIAKTDPQCNDSDTWRENFLMENIILHNNYIHETEGEGMYIGGTFGFENSSRVCGGTQRFAHLIRYVRIYDNIVEDAGWDGFQVSLANDDVKIYDNVIRNYGTRKEGNQNYGLAIGAGSKVEVFNNIITQSSEYHGPDNNPKLQRGISIIDAILGSKFYNNIVVNPGGDGIWMHIRMSNASIGDLNDAYIFVNNTIIEPGGSGIFYNTSIPGGGGSRADLNNVLYNNLIIDPGNNYENSGFWKVAEDAFIDFNEKAQRDQSSKSNNYFTRNISEVGFVNVGSENFDLLENSPAVDAGNNVSDLGINIDFNSNARPVGAAFDIGAFEYGSSTGQNINPTANAGADQSGTINNLITLNGSGSSDSDGNITSYQWEQISGTTVTINDGSSSMASFTPALEGTYTFRLTVTDNGGLTDSDDVNINVTEASSNVLPTADAGPDQSFPVSANIQLNGTASTDSDGTIDTYFWEQIAGEPLTIISSDLATATIEEPAAGVYTFRLTVTDNNGGIDSDEVTHTVTQNITSLVGSVTETTNIFPNPSYGKFSLFINSKVYESVDVSVYTLHGRLVYSKQDNISIGENYITVDLQDLNLKGNYLLLFQSEEIGNVQKILLIK